jgi:hypothetical protein
MKKLEFVLWFAFIAFSLGAAQNQPGAPTSETSSQLPPGVAVPVEVPPAVRILTPLAGQTLNVSYADIRFELVRPALNDEPSFLVQLDSADPVSTSDTEYTFSDLQPGLHTVRVTLVDANNTPVQGGTATVQFKIPSTTRPASNSTPQHFIGNNLQGAAPGAPIPPELRNDPDPKLPLAGSPLPVISIIGFGLLLGGAVQAMRGRR